MARKKKKKSKKSGGAPWWRKPLLVILRFLPWIIVCLALMFSLWMGFRTAWDALITRPAFALNQDNVVLETPRFVDHDAMQESVRIRLGDVLEDAHILDHRIADRVEQELESFVWITEIKSVKKLLPNKLYISAHFRNPAGILQFANQLYLIDRYGYWLPEDLYHQPEKWGKARPPIIVNESLPDRFPHRGKVWEGKALPVGARLSQLFINESVHEFLDIIKIDVSRVGTRSRDWEIADVMLTTKKGVSIGWGTTDEYEEIPGLNRRVDEPSDVEKINKLQELVKEKPELDGIKYLDLTFNTVTYEGTEH